MENATKALLIAAAVLIAIVIIALGVRLLDNSQDVAKQEEEAGKQISDTTTKSSKSIEDSLLKNQGYKIQRKDDYVYTLPATGGTVPWCNQFNTEILLEENKEYIIEFDYEVTYISDNSQAPYWLLGIGRKTGDGIPTGQTNTFERDLYRGVDFTNKKGHVRYIFNDSSKIEQYKKDKNVKKAYLWIRLPTADNAKPYDFHVNIKNFVIKYK